MNSKSQIHLPNEAELMDLLGEVPYKVEIQIGALEMAQSITASEDVEEYDWQFYKKVRILSYNGDGWKESEPSFVARGYRYDMHRNESYFPAGEQYHRRKDVRIIVIATSSSGNTDTERWDDVSWTIYL